MAAAPHFMCYAQWARPLEVTQLISARRSTSVEIGSQFNFNFEDKGVYFCGASPFNGDQLHRLIGY